MSSPPSKRGSISSSSGALTDPDYAPPSPIPDRDDDNDSTDLKLALLTSLHPTLPLETLLEALLASSGNVTSASASLSSRPPPLQAKRQASLTSFFTSSTAPKTPTFPPKGQSILLYNPSQIASLTPITLHHAFLPSSLATSLLSELLAESSTFPPPPEFTLFDRTVTSPHRSCLFLRSQETADRGTHTYQARTLAYRLFTPSMHAATALVEARVNTDIESRYQTRWAGTKPWGAMQARWKVNAAFVNRYDDPKSSVGYHADELTYLGPMAVIASVSLGVAREFRVRRVWGKDAEAEADGEAHRTQAGQVGIVLPHNSLCVMHGGMQEGWKHCIPACKNTDAHPVSGDVRINVTYRCYRESLGPEKTPKCGCGDAILRPIYGPDPESAEEGRRYWWGCAGAYKIGGGGKGCGFFRWAEFDRDGELLGGA